MPVELLIIGTGGQARETAQLARRIDPDGARWERISFVSQYALARSDMPFGEIRYTDADLADWSREVDVAIGIGSPLLRQKIAHALQPRRVFRFPNLVHPRVEIDPAVVSLGNGNLIAQGVVMTCDITVGDFNLINWNVTIGHDCVLGSCCVISPAVNVSGNVCIGDACMVGAGAQLLPHVRLPAHSIVGAGAVVLEPIDASGTFVGVPARRVR